jgi:hypothetical protein
MRPARLVQPLADHPLVHLQALEAVDRKFGGQADGSCLGPVDFDERTIDVAHRRDQPEAKPEVGVHAHADRRVEPSESIHGRPVHEQRLHVDAGPGLGVERGRRPLDAERGRMVGKGELEDGLREGRIVHEADVREAGARLQIAVERIELERQLVREPLVVGVVEGDPVARRVLKADVQGGALAEVRLPEAAQPPAPVGVLPQERVDDCRRAVGRPVVDEQDLGDRNRLIEHAPER